MKPAHKLVLVRHGQSAWNLENRFTGWTDVGLTDAGLHEAREAGRSLRERGYSFDRAFTSVQKRAIWTLYSLLYELDQLWLPVEHHWRLNERHYGALTGLDKSEVLKKYGEEKFQLWRRSFDVAPPAMPAEDARALVKYPQYGDLSEKDIPRTECIKDVIARVTPYWKTTIAPRIEAGERILIAAHGNSLRALVTYLDRLNPDQVAALNIPTGFPLVYELDEKLEPTCHYYLADDATIQQAIDRVAKQGKK